HRVDYRGWILTDGNDEKKVGLDSQSQVVVTEANGKLLKTVRKEILSRIAREPDRIIHYQGLVTWLVRYRAFGEALGIAKSAGKKWPEHWWPGVTVAFLQAKLGFTERGERFLISKARQCKCFNHYFLLARFYKELGKNDKCLRALKEGVRMP